MSNIFKQNKEVNNHAKRNNFDLSFQNHLTMKFGTLYPVFCKEVVPGDSFRIESAFGLKFMPLVFPVQSGMRATMHFFYCRNKNLWKNWENFVSNLEEHTHPYIKQNKEFFKTGSLADYLDIPTTVISSCGQFLQIPVPTDRHPESISVDSFSEHYNAVFHPLTGTIGSFAQNGLPYSRRRFSLVINNFAHDVNDNIKFYYTGTALPSPLKVTEDSYLFRVYGKIEGDIEVYFFAGGTNIESSDLLTHVKCSIVHDSDADIYFLRPANLDFLSEVNNAISSGDSVYPVFGVSFTDHDHTFADWLTTGATVVTKDNYYFGDVVFVSCDVTIPHDISDSSNVFAPASGQPSVRLNALPFRAYQSIYNCYYRNWQNQPYLIGGTPVFNRYNDTLEDGEDTTDYHLYQRNYELDFLTSALPSPMQGNAPLVGMSSLGNITIEDEDGITTAHATLADDGHTITGVEVTSPIAGRAHALTLAEIASAGMSINDFRNTNALTHWLETNIRKGYRYLDFIAGHFGKSPKYNELDLPEFIGGYSRDVQVNTILNQTASPDADPLGSFAGTANCFGGSKHSINHYCDDYGWIVGILCVVPTPAYSQLLPKHFIKNSPLDYYFPEFAQLGMQSVTYEEVCPTQAFSDWLADHDKALTDTFGYQRPNYDMISYTDQVHGDFRLSLRNFLINRLFANRPVLGDDFLQINPDEVNDIFQVTTPENDVIAGQIVFRVHAKRPVPRIHLPSLGR